MEGELNHTGLYRELREVESDPADRLESLRAEVERAREKFHGSMDEVKALNDRRSPSFYASMRMYAFISSMSNDSLNRLMSRLMAQMFFDMMRQMQEEQRRREREEAEKRLYERRREMWDAEKALKAEERRVSKRSLSPVLQRINDKIQRGRDGKSLGE